MAFSFDYQGTGSRNAPPCYNSSCSGP
jgi:hypothetical protein